MKKSFFSIIVISMLFSACKNSNNHPSIVLPGKDPNFTIVPNTDKGFEGFNRKVVVFGIPIYAMKAVADIKLLHAANVMAQYLDNDENGDIDNSLVLDKMIENNAYVVMWNDDPDALYQAVNEGEFFDLGIGQDLGSSETQPSFVSTGRMGEFDAALEEILHIINNAGHSYAYPDIFGQNIGSELANAMDIARAGQFMNIPDEYPEQAWYTYYDETCDYAECQTIEYLYWALTSMLGAQENRLHVIDNEWQLHKRTLVETRDTAIYSILTDPKYKMPTVLPDGTYKH